jgi:hypothetical protein
MNKDSSTTLLMTVYFIFSLYLLNRSYNRVNYKIDTKVTSTDELSILDVKLKVNYIEPILNEKEQIIYSNTVQTYDPDSLEIYTQLEKEKAMKSLHEWMKIIDLTDTLYVR